MATKANDNFRWFLRTLPVAVGIVALIYFVTKPAPAPSNATVFGCYAASNGPAILLDASGMHVRQAGYPIIPYHLERLKPGIALTADAPIRADKTADGYRFGRNARGIGWYLPFYRVENGRTYGVFDVTLLQGFQMLASDGVELNYEPAQTTQCA